MFVGSKDSDRPAHVLALPDTEGSVFAHRAAAAVFLVIELSHRALAGASSSSLRLWSVVSST